MSDNIKPFDRTYVLRTTFRHMIKSVNISIDKTFTRMQEFGDDAERATEAVETLSDLHAVRRALEDYQNANPNLFKGK